jgi:hypothetical protein
MFIIKIMVLFVTFLLIYSAPARKQNLEPYVRFRSIKCSSSNKSLSGYKCYIKAYSQKNTTLNIFFNLTKPAFKLIFNYDLTLKSISNSYRSIINVTYELCSVLNGTAENPIFQWTIGNFPDFKRLMHRCPYKVCSINVIFGGRL